MKIAPLRTIDFERRQACPTGGEQAWSEGEGGRYVSLRYADHTLHVGLHFGLPGIRRRISSMVNWRVAEISEVEYPEMHSDDQPRTLDNPHLRFYDWVFLLLSCGRRFCRPGRARLIEQINQEPAAGC